MRSTFRTIPIVLFVATVFSFWGALVAAQPAATITKVVDAGKADVTVENVLPVNSQFDDANPLISPTDQILYFTSFRGGKQALYASRKGESGWSQPTVFLDLPGKDNIGGISITGDGTQAVVASCNRKDAIFGTCDIYFATVAGGKLSELKHLGKPLNSEWWDGQPCISQDGQLLFFASDRKGGHGGSDIYMASRKVDGNWTDPVSLSLNTSGNELSPFIAADNETLYFAADDLSGNIGGFDIYVSHRTGTNSWSQPKNLGPSVNTKGNELFFSLPPSEDALYLSSDRPGGKGNFDIYRIFPNPVQPLPKIIALHGRVLDKSTGTLIKVTPEIRITLSGTNEMASNTGNGAQYDAIVPLGKLVQIHAEADGYVASTIEVQAPSERDSNGFFQDITLAPSRARVAGHVINAFTHKPVEATLLLTQTAGENNDLESLPSSIRTDAQGAFKFNAIPSSTYAITVEVPNYEVYNSTVVIPVNRQAMVEVEKEIRLTPAGIEPVTLNFDFNKSDLKREELSKMDHFIAQVKENPYVKIEVNGHTDDVGTAEYNAKLSQRRAVAVEDFLLSKGVPRDQLAVVQGFGKSDPIDPRDTEEARARNRRVEVRIVGKD